MGATMTEVSELKATQPEQNLKVEGFRRLLLRNYDNPLIKYGSLLLLAVGGSAFLWGINTLAQAH